MITPEEFKERMRAAITDNRGDREIAHGDMDDLLCEVLRELGYGEGIDIFEEYDKWYA